MKTVTFTQKPKTSNPSTVIIFLLIVFSVSFYFLYKNVTEINANPNRGNIENDQNNKFQNEELAYGSSISKFDETSGNSSTSATSQNENSTINFKIQENVVQTSLSSSQEKVKYNEFTTIISGQTAYISVPENIAETNLPSIVIYSHGSGDTVSKTLGSSIFMKELSDYGSFFASNDFIFAASDEHGENWGSNYALTDINNLISWISTNYPNSGKIYLIGYSMGGLTAMNYALKYPDNIARIALLAPTVYLNTWYKTNVSKFEKIDITIWHGLNDRNLPVTDSESLVSRFKTYGKNITLNEVENINHISVNTSFVSDIWKFFAN